MTLGYTEEEWDREAHDAAHRGPRSGTAHTLNGAAIARPARVREIMGLQQPCWGLLGKAQQVRPVLADWVVFKRPLLKLE